MSDIRVGDHVEVKSGPHEGASGQVIRMRGVSVGYSDPQDFALIQVGQTEDDQVTVSVGRLRKIR